MTITTGASFLRGPRMTERELVEHRANRIRKDVSAGRMVDDKKRKLRLSDLEAVKERLLKRGTK